MDKIGLIDFKGQHDVQKYTHLLLYSSATVAFLVGFVLQNVHTTLYTFLTGVLLTFLTVVPPWPIFKTEPSQWLENETKKRYAEAVLKLQEELDNEESAKMELKVKKTNKASRNDTSRHLSSA